MAEVLGHSERVAVPDAGASLIKVVWSNTTLAHLRLIRDYIEQFNLRAARQLAAGLAAAGDSLANFPHRGRPVPGTDRRELVTVYPTIIRYRVAGDTVRILRIRHSARRQRGQSGNIAHGLGATSLAKRSRL
jgi:toxin ParE1/3/4